MRLRQKLFYLILILTLPLWLTILLGMFAWDIADNFRGQINYGYQKLLTKDGKLREVT